MKILMLLTLLAILCVLTFVAVEYHAEQKRQEHERLEQAFHDCLKVAPGSHLCDDIGKQLAEQN